jgi:hypothetical protein
MKAPSTRVQPDNDINKSFQIFYMNKLDAITTGDAKAATQYANGRMRRAWGICSCTVCFTAFCIPCAVWDTLCLSSEFLCRKSCCWGASYLCASKSIDEIYKPVDGAMETYFKEHRTSISAATVQKVCTSWMNAFDGFVTTRQVDDARKANIIRNKLVTLVRTYAPISYEVVTLEDNGDIDHLRNLIKKMA